MTEVKQKLTFDQQAMECESEDDLRAQRTSIENFSNEIFYEIFDYLDGCRLYQAFANLNFRFQPTDQFLMSSIQNQM